MINCMHAGHTYAIILPRLTGQLKSYFETNIKLNITMTNVKSITYHNTNKKMLLFQN